MYDFDHSRDAVRGTDVLERPHTYRLYLRTLNFKTDSVAEDTPFNAAGARPIRTAGRWDSSAKDTGRAVLIGRATQVGRYSGSEGEPKFVGKRDGQLE